MKTREEAEAKAKEISVKWDVQSVFYGAMDMFDWLSQEDEWIKPTDNQLIELPYC